MTCIYTLSDPRDSQIRYVGKADNLDSRLYRHIYYAGKEKSHKANWIKGLKDSGLKPIMEILEEIPESDWGKAECYWIDQMRAWGFNLVNDAPGGLGGAASLEARKKISAKLKGAGNPSYGKPITPEVKDKIRAKLKGRISPMKGRKWTPEQRERKKRTACRGEAHPNWGKHLSAELRRKIGQSHEGKTLSENHKASIGIGVAEHLKEKPRLRSRDGTFARY